MKIRLPYSVVGEMPQPPYGQAYRSHRTRFILKHFLTVHAKTFINYLFMFSRAQFQYMVESISLREPAFALNYGACLIQGLEAGLANSMALNLIAEVMGWEEADTSPANREYAWLKMMSAIKYDGYADFRAGVRFIESLAVWLKQFDKSDRHAAYDFIKRRLVYISPAELQCLIENFMPEVVTPNLRQIVADQIGVKPYEVWNSAEGAKAYKSRLRRTLFIGMSDGSRMDILRRANSGKISNEQILPTLMIDHEKWRSMAGKLQKAENDETAMFDSVYLIEDFTASGTTFIRRENGIWDGKLAKFDNAIREARVGIGEKFPLVDHYSLHIHHYISTEQARLNLDDLISQARANWSARTFGEISVTEGIRLPASLKLQSPEDDAILKLCSRYHDPGLDVRLKESLAASGKGMSVKYGYAECALPLIMDHNTPNNSIALLWAETHAEEGNHSMDPLFRRRDRHG